LSPNRELPEGWLHYYSEKNMQMINSVSALNKSFFTTQSKFSRSWAKIAALLITAIFAAPLSAQQVFINEIHYDNASTDTGEAIEVAGPAGTDLTGWTIALYNGSSSQLSVYSTITLAGIIADQSGGFGTLSFLWSGIQNGSPDGLALVDSGANVIQFLSYEGSFTAAAGPASGSTSTDIGVSEASGSAVGDSLQLTGSGSQYEDFSWVGSQPNTFATVNVGQNFDGDGGSADPVINEFVFNHTGADSEAFIEVFGSASTDYSALTVLEVEGDSSGAGTIDAVLPVGTTNAGGFWINDEDAENGTVTLLLVEGFSGSIGDDLDTDNDGVLDSTPWTQIVDDVAVHDGGSSDRTYAGTVLNRTFDGGSFTVGGASRIPNGADTDSTADWVRNDYHGFGFPGFDGTQEIGEAINTPDAVNAVITVIVDPFGACEDPATLIHDIQGSGLASTDTGNIRAVEAVVVATFLDSGQIGGYFVQEEDSDADGDPLTSEGLRIFDTTNTPAMGDVVRILGSVTERFGLTQLNNITDFAVCGSGVATAATPGLPVNSIDDFEAYEGMAVTFPQALVISEYFNFDRFGEITLTSKRHLTPTAEFEPGVDAIQAAQDFLLDRITLDDGRGTQNPDPAIHPNGAVFDLSNLFRGGDTVQQVTGVMDYAFGKYRIQPTQGANYTSVNPRTAEPDPVGGNFRVASFNVLNYFNGDGLGGGFPTSRGADDPAEFIRQRDKIIAAMVTIDADVFGVMEIENDGYDSTSAIQDLVNGLNDATAPGTYNFIDPGVPTIGSDAIAVGLIYNATETSPQGNSAVLDSSVDIRFNDTKNRPALAQTFVDSLTDSVFTVVVNHLKSKGSNCSDVGDPDTGDGADSCNLTRAEAAVALVDWIASDPTGSGDADALIIGDLNSYDKEDPIVVLTAAGYTDLSAIFNGESAYSYTFDGQIGYLDYALANPSLFAQVTGTTEWHINADESDLINYDTSFKQSAQDAIYAPDAYRSSDHDPVIVGLELHYDFTGFFRPIDNMPAVNKVKAGSGVPIKFSLNGDYGLNILADGYPVSQEIDCNSGLPLADTEETGTAGRSSLSYDQDLDQYKYVWKTNKSWKGSCRQLIVQLIDDSSHYANFKFK